MVRHSSSSSLGGHEYRARSKGRTILAQHAKSVKHCVANGLQAATAKQLPTRALSQGAKLKNTCRTVQVLPECLRLSTIPAVHCNVATKGSALESRTNSTHRTEICGKTWPAKAYSWFNSIKNPTKKFLLECKLTGQNGSHATARSV